MDDLISRQAAIEAIERAKTVRSQDGEIYVAKLNAEMNIQILPSEERKKGHWIEYDNSHCECPVCHEEWSYFDDEPDRFNFCPNCGAELE